MSLVCYRYTTPRVQSTAAEDRMLFLSEEQSDPPGEPVAARRDDGADRRRVAGSLHRDETLARAHESELARFVHDVRVGLALRDLGLKLRVPRLFAVDPLLHEPRFARDRGLLHRDADERAAEEKPRDEHRGRYERTDMARQGSAHTAAG